MNFTEFYKCSLNFILKFSTLLLTTKLQSHFFIVRNTINGDKSYSNQCYSGSESATTHCSRHIGLSKIEKSVCVKHYSTYSTHLNNVVMNFTEFY